MVSGLPVQSSVRFGAGSCRWREKRVQILSVWILHGSVQFPSERPCIPTSSSTTRLSESSKHLQGERRFQTHPVQPALPGTPGRPPCAAAIAPRAHLPSEPCPAHAHGLAQAPVTQGGTSCRAGPRTHSLRQIR